MRKYALRDLGLNILDIVLNVVIIVVLVYFVRSFIISPFQVYGPSMCDTLNFINNRCLNEYGEYIIVNKITYLGPFGDPERGDVIVFKPPDEEEDFFIKRIIGLPGDKIEIKGGKVYIQNEEHPEPYELDEPYLNERNSEHTATFGETEFEVPEGKYFALGDNRDKSTDSRSCFRDPFSGGCKGDDATAYLDEEDVEGKAWLVLWPFNRMRFVE